jgi:hypothetical protein
LRGSNGSAASSSAGSITPRTSSDSSSSPASLSSSDDFEIGSSLPSGEAEASTPRPRRRDDQGRGPGYATDAVLSVITPLDPAVTRVAVVAFFSHRTPTFRCATPARRLPPDQTSAHRDTTCSATRADMTRTTVVLTVAHVGSIVLKASDPNGIVATAIIGHASNVRLKLSRSFRFSSSCSRAAH